MEDDVRTGLVKLGDPPYLLGHLAWRDVSTLAFHIEPCMHVEVLAELVSLHACLLENVNKLPLLFHITNLSNPVGNFMRPFKTGPSWEALPQMNKPSKHLLLLLLLLLLGPS